MDKPPAFVYSVSVESCEPCLAFPAYELWKEETIMRYVCNLCGWVYDEEEQGVKWEDLPEDFACELCGAGKDEFSPEE